MFDLNAPNITGDCSKAFEYAFEKSSQNLLKISENILYLGIVFSVAWIAISVTRLYAEIKHSVTHYNPVDRVDKKGN